jgi:hypothetical protein
LKLEGLSNDPRRQLEELDSKVAHLEALLEQLKGKQIPLKRQINRLCAPVLRLPPELSSEIFLAYLPVGRISPRNGLARTPLVLGSVCSDWRNQAWSMPWLWNRICVCLNRRRQRQCTPTVTGLLEEWLALSRDLPLSIDLRYDERVDSDEAIVTAIITVIASFCERWHSISFSLPSSLFQAFRCVQGRLTRLTSVTLSLWKTDGQHVVEDAVQLFSVAPRLQKVEWWLDWNRSVLPMAQLTHLSVHPRDFEVCLDILRSSPRLIKGDFLCVSPRTSPRSLL